MHLHCCIRGPSASQLPRDEITTRQVLTSRCKNILQPALRQPWNRRSADTSDAPSLLHKLRSPSGVWTSSMHTLVCPPCCHRIGDQTLDRIRPIGQIGGTQPKHKLPPHNTPGHCFTSDATPVRQLQEPCIARPRHTFRASFPIFARPLVASRRVATFRNLHD
jgi:hypothetical protein